MIAGSAGADGVRRVSRRTIELAMVRLGADRGVERTGGASSSIESRGEGRRGEMVWKSVEVLVRLAPATLAEGGEDGLEVGLGKEAIVKVGEQAY
jgi:hypothetical protein